MVEELELEDKDETIEKLEAKARYFSIEARNKFKQSKKLSSMGNVKGCGASIRPMIGGGGAVGRAMGLCKAIDYLGEEDEAEDCFGRASEDLNELQTEAEKSFAENCMRGGVSSWRTA